MGLLSQQLLKTFLPSVTAWCSAIQVKGTHTHIPAHSTINHKRTHTHAHAHAHTHTHTHTHTQSHVTRLLLFHIILSLVGVEPAVSSAASFTPSRAIEPSPTPQGECSTK